MVTNPALSRTLALGLAGAMPFPSRHGCPHPHTTALCCFFPQIPRRICNNLAPGLLLMKQLTFCLLFCGVAISFALAQAAPASSTTPATPAPAASSSTPSDIILEYSPPPEQYQKAKEYSGARYRHFFFNTFYGFLVLLVILRWRVASAIRNLAEHVTSRRWLQIIIFAPLALLCVSIPELATDINDQRLDLAFGISVQKWPSWLSDWITNQIVTLVVGTILVAILFWVIRRSPRRWWFYFWLASIPVLLLVFFLQPLVIDPLFFTFKPLQGAQPVLVEEMQKVMHHGGIDIPPERMFVMNASSKTTGLNAYVTGFGSSKRVVVWDNTLTKATVPETLFVFGHEMGHYVLLHIPKEIAIQAAIILILLYLAFRMSQWMLARWGREWGIRDSGDLGALPAYYLVISLLAFLATPAFNGVSRHFEHEADRYGIEVTHGIVANPSQVAAHYFQKSGEMNLSDPDPSEFAKIWFFDHPTRPERVRFVATYDPWSKGEQPIYVK